MKEDLKFISLVTGYLCAKRDLITKQNRLCVKS